MADWALEDPKGKETVRGIRDRIEARMKLFVEEEGLR